jgi:sugar/nucleoside kinase (ribokinase family)
MAKLAPVLPETDLFMPNTDEAAVLTGLNDPIAQAERFVAAGAGAAVITCGDAGSVLISHTTRLRAAAHSMDYQGGTGAGDAFVAGTIAGLLAGEDLSGALRWGSAVGASCVRSISATDSVFTRAEAEQFLRANPLAVDLL